MHQTLITVLRYSITYYQKDLFICAQYVLASLLYFCHETFHRITSNYNIVMQQVSK